MPPAIPSKATHEQWLALVQPVGLVVAPAVLSFDQRCCASDGVELLSSDQRQP